MSIKKLQMAYYISKSNSGAKFGESPIPRDIHEDAGRCLVKLFKDSLYLNDKSTNVDKNTRLGIEDEIVNDFCMVREYIQYLLIRLAKFGIDLESQREEGS